MKIPALLFLFFIARAAQPAVASSRPAAYFWTARPVGHTAELVTLTCRGCNTVASGAIDAEPDVPLLAVLKDTLGDANPANDRLTAVWLLSYSPPSLGQRILSGVPFFYWGMKGRHTEGNETNLKPELDFTSLQHPSLDAVRRDALQWLTLDPSTLPVRAATRAYRTNQLAGERLHLEESVSYLRAASDAGAGPLLSQAEIETLIARLELRKTLLGGFVTERAAARFGQTAAAERERVRDRNWEILRQCAEKTGLRFEPINLAGTQGEYAMLWAPVKNLQGNGGSRLDLIWKLLNIRKPSNADLARLAQHGAYPRTFDANGTLLPPGESGTAQADFVPLSVYSLNYPKMPLLLVDFRGGRHIRWHAMTQRSINEVTAGIIGISHFTNWYYYVGADFYDLLASRHGAALNQAERLDCYSQFRVALALDQDFNPRLRRQMLAQVNALSMNPLDGPPQDEVAAAADRSDTLEGAAADGRLLKLIDRDRRAELANDLSGHKRLFFDDVFHTLTFGAYTHRAPGRPDDLAQLDALRRTQNQLALLDRATADGTQPEVTMDAARLQSSLAELKDLLPGIESEDLRAHAAATIARVQQLSNDESLRADCRLTLAALPTVGRAAAQNIALQPAAVQHPAFAGDAAQHR